MKKIKLVLASLVIALSSVSVANARDSFSLGINIGGYGYAPPVVQYYPAPPVVYYYSQPTYYYPAPPVVYYPHASFNYYNSPRQYWRGGGWGHHGHHEGEYEHEHEHGWH